MISSRSLSSTVTLSEALFFLLEIEHKTDDHTLSCGLIIYERLVMLWPLVSVDWFNSSDSSTFIVSSTASNPGGDTKSGTRKTIGLVVTMTMVALGLSLSHDPGFKRVGKLKMQVCEVAKIAVGYCLDIHDRIETTEE
jgi:hypothetical protein